jgi:RHS repeat-associated protein
MISLLRSLLTARRRATLAALLLSGAAAWPQGALACPGDGGATCGAADAPATQPGATSVNIGAGNPINIITGNKYQREDDLPALPGVLGLEIVRHYNSRFSGTAAVPGLVGRGWKLSYETELAIDGDTIRAWQADGSSFMFRRDLANPALANSADPANGSIAIRRNGAGRDEYLWRWANGRELSFDQRGKLVQIKAATGEILSLLYDTRGLLVKVTDPQGRSLRLSYLDRQQVAAADRFRGVQSIDTPVGRFSYEYGNPPPKSSTLAPQYLLANLVRVRYPASAAGAAGTGRQYHYEAAAHPTNLTGITIEGQGADGKPTAQRYATFGYQADGRAVLSTHANDVDKVTVSFERPGITVVKNSAGQQTTYRYASMADDYRLLEVRGAGCALCGPPNQRYRYDSQGRLLETIELDSQGLALHSQVTEVDHYGRALLVSRIEYIKGKAQPAQWQLRYEYAPGSAGGPVLIARPSVVPGREAVTRIAYNDRGQPISVTVSGWSPQPPGMGAPLAIVRTTRYAYQMVNGLSVLAQVDGPLANGKANSPADSDITRFEFEASGHFVSRVTAPGGIVTDVRERDAALRPVVLRRVDGALQQIASNRLNWRGQTEVGSVAATQAGADAAQTRTLQYAYDAAGNLAGVTQPGNLTTRYVYDGAGRLAEQVLADGSRIATPRDTEGRQPGAASPTGSEQDLWGRSVAWRDASGAPLLQAQWGAIGTAAQGDVLALSTRNAQAQRLLDDDGRVVAIRNPGQGWQTARYDAAGRIEEATDPRGARQRASWDVAGRLLRLERYAAGASTAEQVLTYRYAGAWASEETITDADGARTTLTVRDAQGRVLSETLRITATGTLAAALAQPVQISQSYRYDAAGRVVARTLTDNTGRTLELATTLDAQGLPANIAATGLLPSWLGGRQALIDRVQWQQLPGGPYATEIAHGDGSIDRYPRIDTGRVDADGVTTPAAPASATSAATATATTSATSSATSSATAAALADAPSALPDGGMAATASVTDAGQDRAPLAGPGASPDSAGLPATVTTAQGEQRLRWNAAGQLSATARAGGSSRYLYDARGRRVVKLVTDAQGAVQVALMAYEGNNLVAEADAQGRASFAYVHLGSRPVAQLDLRPGSWWQTVQARLFGVTSRHLHTSRAGQVQNMTEGGKVVWQDASSNRANPVHQPLRYVGQYHDADSGLAYHGARYFEPGSGRFISPDPQGVADAVNELSGDLLLDLYAYAGGQPNDYFDPDGAARIRYFAITTKANGQAIGQDQGYTKARWAFIVDNIQGGGDSSALGQKRNEYAQNGAGLLVDANGSFLGVGQEAATWTGANGRLDEFTAHYGANLIAIPEFTINDMSDDDATKLIASYIAADRQALFPTQCPGKSTLLPPIKFGTGDADINIMMGTANGANKQRILACGAGSSTDITLRRIAKYEAAAETNETARINRDCSTTGCPGIGYYCSATKCFTPRDQLLYGPPDTTEPVYTPSYGRSQFIGSTLVGELLGGYTAFSADILTQLGLTQPMKTSLESAKVRGNKMVAWWDSAVPAANYAAANQAWANLSAANKTRFTAETGLGERAYVDMIRIKTQPPTNSNGADLSGDAKQALVTTAIMSDTVVKDLLMGIFQDFDKFTVMSHALMRKNLEAAIAYQSTASEAYLAAMVARAHNGGVWKRTYQQLTTSDSYDYVKNFIGAPGHTVKGDWKSLRCTESLGDNTVRPGTGGVGIGGLQFTPLILK